MQPANANGIQVVFVQQPNWMPQGGQIPRQVNIRNDFAKKLITFGSLHIAFGGLCIIFQAISVGIFANSYSPTLDFVGHGFWTGVMFIVTGPFGIIGGQRKSRGYVITFNVLSILSSVFAAVLLSLSIPSAVAYVSHGHYHYYYGSGDAQIAASVMDAFLAILAVAEGIVAILSAVLCCKVGACGDCCDCCSCCECCCPPSNYAVQSAVPPQLIGQSIEGQHQPIVLYNASTQQQFPMMVNQQPMFYAVASDQQLMIDQSVQQQRGHEHSDRDKLVE